MEAEQPTHERFRDSTTLSDPAFEGPSATVTALAIQRRCSHKGGLDLAIVSEPEKSSLFVNSGTVPERKKKCLSCLALKKFFSLLNANAEKSSFDHPG